MIWLIYFRLHDYLINIYPHIQLSYSYVFLLGGGAVGTYNYVSHSGKAVVSSASITITSADLDKGSDTTSCTQDYSRSLDDDGKFHINIFHMICTLKY